MLKRVELHNHTSESDGNMSVGELVKYMTESNVDAVAITDHNTISGHKKGNAFVSENDLPIEIIKGVELTTYYGHILCLNLDEYIDWDDINCNKPERLFERVKSKGGLVGIAHPFSDGAPFCKGCKWEMDINDYTKVDFIEIFNNPEDLHKVNGKAIDIWEKLILEGYKIAATTGMDLHGKLDMNNNFHTYIDVNANIEESISDALKRAIKDRNVFISKSDILEASIKKYENYYILEYDLVNVNDMDHIEDKENIIISIKSNDFEFEVLYSEERIISLDNFILEEGDPIIVKSYYKEKKLDNLLSIAPVIYTN